VQPLTINVLSTLHSDNIIDVCSSGSYDLSLFSSKADSTRDAGRVVMLGESSSLGVNDDWPEASAVVERFRDKGVLSTIEHGHLEVAVELDMFSSGGHNPKKRKKLRARALRPVGLRARPLLPGRRHDGALHRECIMIEGLLQEAFMTAASLKPK
jgi:hypothetical protein